MDAKTGTRRNLDDVVAGGRKISPSQFAHIVLNTADYARLRDWYLTFFNGTIVTETETVCFMTFDDEHHRMAIGHDPNVRAHETLSEPSNVSHFAYSYRDLGELLYTYRRLKRAGIAPVWSVNHGMTTSFYYRDPDNNMVEIQADVFSDGDEAKRWMEREIPGNLLGITFDPEDMVTKYEAGVPVAELMHRRDLKPGERVMDQLPEELRRR